MLRAERIKTIVIFIFDLKSQKGLHYYNDKSVNLCYNLYESLFKELL